jgi:hypothetical protein
VSRAANHRHAASVRTEVATRVGTKKERHPNRRVGNPSTPPEPMLLIFRVAHPSRRWFVRRVAGLERTRPLPFDPAQRHLRMNRAVARFTNSNSTCAALGKLLAEAVAEAAGEGNVECA